MDKTTLKEAVILILKAIGVLAGCALAAHLLIALLWLGDALGFAM